MHEWKKELFALSNTLSRFKLPEENDLSGFMYFSVLVFLQITSSKTDLRIVRKNTILIRNAISYVCWKTEHGNNFLCRVLAL